MATVFLSFDRDDSVKARSFATALEVAGHAVWWDQHIKAGRQFSHEIDKALKEADVVIVFWSKNSVESAWVRDEAAVGRDSGRLIPVPLDGCAHMPSQSYELFNSRARSASLNATGWE